MFLLILPGSTRLNVDVSLNLLFKETSTLERVRLAFLFATGKVTGNYPEQFFSLPTSLAFRIPQQLVLD